MNEKGVVTKVNCKLLMRQHHKLKLLKDVLIRSTREYNQIVIPSSMQDVVILNYTKNVALRY